MLHQLGWARDTLQWRPVCSHCFMAPKLLRSLSRIEYKAFRISLTWQSYTRSHPNTPKVNFARILLRLSKAVQFRSWFSGLWHCGKYPRARFVRQWIVHRILPEHKAELVGIDESFLFDRAETLSRATSLTVSSYAFQQMQFPLIEATTAPEDILHDSDKE